ncbi:PepSY domain-containing protein [Thiohalophilus sp.]|uniref:PepSY domain-containing protein n=1 Tax=Thiohalophilus sp. TaxID=3028392 RepID=UPI002ACEE338|nr:PepSY domain-containing protein [Thiohalophilus sp.]MDZ7805167.1 PepSY domain-containing protein [Thiohalophilus sp.]
MTRHKRPRLKLKSVYQWHRYIGISAALFVILISVTGIMLNHTEQMNLDEQYVQSNWLLDWYGVQAPQQTSGYLTREHWVSQWDSRLLTQTRDLGHYDRQILGAISYHGMLIVALEGELLLLTPEGKVIETLRGYQGVPAGMWAIGLTSDKRVAVKAAHGTYVADADLITWEHQNLEAVRWSAPSTLPRQVHQKMLQLYRGKGLDMERVILDLHSGRLLKQGGIYFFDFIAVALIFLACSGLWLWGVRQYKARQHHR